MPDSKWDAMVHNPEVPVADYIQHERALQEYEGEKLNRLKIMARAQEIRTWFLKLSMADRKVFLDVLTSDEGGSMTHLFSLQAKLETKGMDDDDLRTFRPGVLASAENRIQGVRKGLRVGAQTAQRKQRKQKLLAGSRSALPPGQTLTLPGAKP